MDPAENRGAFAGSSSAAAPAFDAGERLMSVDALRGFDMLWIIGADAVVQTLSTVSNNAVTRGLTKQFEHQDWGGFTFYDLIFPLFVFVVGVALVFSLSKTIAREGRRTALLRVLRRSVLLYVLGIIYSGGVASEWPDIRLLGVLNRIALCYLFTGLAFIFLKPRGMIALCIGLLVGYWALMTFVPVPGIGAGVFEKGRNLANYLDQHYLPGRRYDETWDPEGLLSTLPAIATCLLGVFAGLVLKDSTLPERRKIGWLIIGGAVAAALGWLWGRQFPVIKKIWTSSYVLVAGGYSAMLLGAFYAVVDVWKYHRWCQPFVWVGMNSITIYLLHNFLDFKKLATRFAGGDVRAFLDTNITKGMGQLAINLVSLTLVLLLCRFLYQRKIFLRL